MLADATICVAAVPPIVQPETVRPAPALPRMPMQTMTRRVDDAVPIATLEKVTELLLVVVLRLAVHVNVTGLE